MKNLIYKELKLCLNPQLIIFACLSILVAIPSWPSAIGFIYTIVGISTIFPRALADKDIMYSAMLPIRKGDVVKGKVLLVSVVECFSLLISIPFALFKILYLDPTMVAQTLAEGGDTSEATYIMAVEPNLTSYGIILFALGIFAIIFFPWYYKNPAKIYWPHLVGTLAATVILGLGIVVQAVVPCLQNLSSSFNLIIQLVILVVGLASCVGLTIWGEKLAEKSFMKVDL